MAYQSADEAKQILRPYAADLLEVFDLAFQDWIHRPPAWHGVGPRSRASVVFDQLGRHAQDVLARHPDISFYERYGVTHVLLASSGVDLRFKKLNRDGTLNSNETIEQLRLLYQQPLPGLPTETHLVVGYLLAEDQASIEHVLVCSHEQPKDPPVWSFNLAHLVTATIPTVLPAAPTARPAQVTVKSDQDKAEGEVAG